MEVLLLEHGEAGELDIERSLTDAGHKVVQCHAPGEPAFPCKGLTDPGSCPLDAGPVAVAVDVGPPAAVVPEHNDGFTCALRRDVPVVSVTDEPDPTVVPFIASSVRPEDVVEAVAAAAKAPLPEHTKVAHEALVDTLERHGFASGGSWAQAARSGSGVVIRLASGEPVPTSIQQSAAVRVLGAVNRIDRDASTVSVGFVPD
jgi:hypothetical protein